MTELLTTKLYIPRPRPNLVARPRLVERMNAGLDRKLTLIAAPAGFGKTTLLSEWIPQSPHCVTWLFLDAGDNDPNQFLSYLIASLQQLRPDLGNEAKALLKSPQVPPITSILTTLINEITEFPDVFSSVLDDYHFVQSQPIHEALTFLIDHLPPNFHLIITSRADPPLPLARLRANDQLTEFRANDLRFSEHESETFLNQQMGLNLSAEEISTLEARTEGWIAGLQIAALSMQGDDDIPGFIRTFSGSHRHIIGYLAEEVIDRIPNGTLNFLLQTSILNRLCGPLCDAVTRDSNGEEILENLEHSDLFLSPLDDVGKWYRYHHLFKQVLKARLKQTHPEMIFELHQRASTWYEMHGQVAEAIEHSLSAGDETRAAELVNRERWRLLGRGEVNTLRIWLDKLPSELIRKEPELNLAYAWINIILRQAEAIEPHIQVAEKALEAITFKSTGVPSRYSDAIKGEIATTRASVALSHSDPLGAIELCRQALKLLPNDDLLMLAFATYFLGHGKLSIGHMKEAIEAFKQAGDLGFEADNLLIALHAMGNVSRVQIRVGHLNAAAETSQSILQITSDRSIQAWPAAGAAYYGLSRVYYEWNDLESAERYSRLGIESGQRGGLTGLELSSLKMLAYTLQAKHDTSGANQVLGQAAEITEKHQHPLDTADAAAWKTRLKLWQGKKEEAIRWANTSNLSVEDVELHHAVEERYLTLARVRIAQKQSESLVELLDRLQQSAESDERTGSLIEILVLRALTRQLERDRLGALKDLEHALNLAEKEGYVRIFIDEGEPMRWMLDEYQLELGQKVSSGIENSSMILMDYVERLLAVLSQQGHPSTQETKVLIEPLSDRELTILRLIASGRTNKEIAELLVIAVSTVKSHINHLYGKLGANRRTQAIAIAQDLGLLSDKPRKMSKQGLGNERAPLRN